MAETLGKAVLELVASTTGLTQGLEEGEAETKGMASRSANSLVSGIGGAFKTIGVAALGFGVLDWSKHAIESGEALIKSQNSLDAAITHSGGNIDDFARSTTPSPRVRPSSVSRRPMPPPPWPKRPC